MSPLNSLPTNAFVSSPSSHNLKRSLDIIQTTRKLQTTPSQAKAPESEYFDCSPLSVDNELQDRKITNGFGSQKEGGRIYIGEWKDGLQTGRGVLHFQGCVFTGTFVNGKLDGTDCTIEYANGDKYEGECKSGLRHGKGILTNKKAGITYDGVWVNNILQTNPALQTSSPSPIPDNEQQNGNSTYSFGILKYIDCYTYYYYSAEMLKGKLKGNYYSGEMLTGKLKDKITGKGVFHYKGNVYSGTFIDSYLNDKNGTILYANGDRYEGECQFDKRHGQGILTNAKGEVIHNGKWVNNFFQAPPTLQIPSPATAIPAHNKAIESEVSGTLKFPNGDTYIGNILSGEAHGRGSMESKDGTKYTGEWRHNMRHGFGISIYTSGNQYIGSYSNDLRHGRGLLMNAKNEVIHDGKWVNDSFQEATPNTTH